MADSKAIQFRMAHALMVKLEEAAKSQKISVDTALSRAVTVWLRSLDKKS